LPPQPSLAQRRFAESGVLRSFDQTKPETIVPALDAITDFLKEEPHSDMYFMRALVGCFAHVAPIRLLSDIDIALSSKPSNATLSAHKTKRDLYSFKAKIEFDSGRFHAAADDLENAIKEDYESAPQMFNDGEVKPSLTVKPCSWSQADLNVLAERLPKDFRPTLALGLYLNYFTRFNSDTDFQAMITAFERSATLNPTSPLPALYVGEIYTMGNLGGILSSANAKCIDDITPRAPRRRPSAAS
jgi:hypothetical protein